jgi:hypothetical protein
MTDEELFENLDRQELLESIDRHFMAGCGFLDAVQLRAHERSGVCPECTARAALASRRVVAGRGAADGQTT